MSPRGWPPAATGSGWWLTVRVWATALDPRVRSGARAGRLSYAFPVVLALAGAGLWAGGAL